VLFDSARAFELPLRARGLGYVPQEGLLFPHLDVRGNLSAGLGRALARNADPRALFQRVCDVLELGALLERFPATLSGGERQRVSIATLFAQEAPLMLLDEPVAHLDLRHQIGVLDQLARRARDGCGVVLSIHDLTLARGCATHAVLLHGGGRATTGRIEDVMTDAALTDAFACPVARVDAGGRAVYVAG